MGRRRGGRKFGPRGAPERELPSTWWNVLFVVGVVTDHWGDGGARGARRAGVPGRMMRGSSIQGHHAMS